MVSSTNVEEGRRSNRVNAISYVVRGFNKKSAEEVSQQKGKTVDRVEGRDRVHLYSNHCDSFNESVERARASIGEEKHGQLVTFLEGDTNRVSRTDLEAQKEKYAEGVEKPRKETKSEQSRCGLDIPAEMDGSLKKKDIQKKYDAQIRAEIEFRRLVYPRDEEGNRKTYEQLSIAEKKELLINDEMGIIASELRAREGIQPDDVKYITPQSQEMKALVVRINSS